MPADPPELARLDAADVKAEALRVGFDRAGIARAERLAAADRLREWLAAGRHGSMEWMADQPERREDVRRELPWAKSVVCVALSYAPSLPEPPHPAGAGRVARYARGADYHAVMNGKLDRLADFMKARGARTWRWADTGPLMEKAWAEAAGVGWVGKNTNLIHERAGSWLVLGEVVTDAELEPDPPAEDRCGSCTRCLEACPTQAFTAAWELDARRCISYLTIEHRGGIEPELRAKMGDWVFGCDVCQEVCPWNSGAPAGRDSGLAARHAAAAPDPAEWLRLTREDRLGVVRGTAMRRARVEMMRRNAAVALGNIGDPAALPALREAADDPDPLVAEHARWSIGRLASR
jgi:epoxyqueuosine reductase